MKWITRERPKIDRIDFEMLEIGMKIYDALYSWAKYASDERHTWKHDLAV